jgi:cytochrome c
MTKKPGKEKKQKNRPLVIGIMIIIIILGYMLFFSGGVPAERGEELYNAHCIACHGFEGVGERPDDKYAKDQYGYVAPPMDDSGHAWHHTDEQLKTTVLEGSLRNPKMAAFKHVLSEEDADEVVKYIKSLWSPYIRENCQGPKHMSCM